MKCDRCTTVPKISHVPGEAVFICAVEKVQELLLAILTAEGFNPQVDDEGIVKVAVDDFANLMERLALRADIPDAMAQEISVLFLEQGQQLNFSALRSARTLKKWLFLLHNQDFLDILENQSITTWFQPIVSLPDLQVVAYECLTRGVKADGSLVPPNLLFRLAEENDLLFFLDRLCRENSLKTSAVKKINADVFINFVPTSIYSPEHCLQSTMQWAQQLHYDPHRIVFEVVESHQVEDIAHLRKILDYFREKGFRTALDDIGSGHTNLATLAALGPDIIKTDMEIVRDIHRDRVKQSIFDALVAIAKNSGIKVLAEGVETPDELAYVTQHGADLAQGYLFAKPSPEPVRMVRRVF